MASMADKARLQKYTRKNGVTGTEVFQITKDGCCQVKRPGNEEENPKKFC